MAGIPTQVGSASGTTSATLSAVTPAAGATLFAWCNAYDAAVIPVTGEMTISDTSGATNEYTGTTAWEEVGFWTYDTTVNRRQGHKLFRKRFVTSPGSINIAAVFTNQNDSTLEVISVVSDYKFKTITNIVTDTDTAGDPVLTLSSIGYSSLALAFVASQGNNSFTAITGYAELSDANWSSSDNRRGVVAYSTSYPAPLTYNPISGNTYLVGILLELIEDAPIGAAVQIKVGTSNLATTTIAFDTAPTSGNLIVLAFASDDYNGTVDSGWTESSEMEQQTFHGAYLWWRISNGGNSFQYTIGSGVHSAWVMAEFAGIDASPYDGSQGQFVQSSAGNYTTDTIVPTTGTRLLIAGMGASAGASTLAGNYSNWLNQFAQVANSGWATSTAVSMALGMRVVEGDNSTGFSTGATYPNTAVSRSGLIISFKKAAGGGGAINGSVTQTLGAVTSAATGTLPIAGVTNATLGNVTVVATGVSPIVGTLNKTLDALVATGISNLPLNGITNQTLQALSGVSASQLIIKGTTTATLGDVTSVAVGSSPRNGVLAQTLGTLVSTGVSNVPLFGTLTRTLGDVTLSAQGSSVSSINGALTATLGNLTLVSNGVTPIQGLLGVSLGTLLASGAAGLIIKGSVGATLADVTVVSTGKLIAKGTTAVVLGSLVSSGFGSLIVKGQVTATLGSLTLNAIGTQFISFEVPDRNIIKVPPRDWSVKVASRNWILEVPYRNWAVNSGD